MMYVSPHRPGTVHRWLTVAWILITILCAAAAPAAVPEQVDVYVSGQDGYHTYRIPAIIRAANGDLLAFCEGRRLSGADSGDIDLLVKRSTDGGRTWGSFQVLWDDGPNTCGNPCPVLDASTRVVWLLLTHNLGADREHEIHTRTAQGTRTVWVMHSGDNGRSWSKPVEITRSVKDSSWRWYATGPGVGIQLADGPHAGRLVVPCDHSYRDPDTNTLSSGSHVIYSDDHGATWKQGGTLGPGVNECQVAELFDGKGTLLIDMRSNSGRYQRAEATSVDGGQTWSRIVDAPALVEPVCQASLLRDDDAHALLFSNPAARTRTNLTVRRSNDDGRTWHELIVLHPGPSAYSCLVALDGNIAGCLYERGEKRPYEKITFARFEVGLGSADTRR